jgi:4-amino-4-deoxy-L-arabinose transferase-like glycosyltransferase
VLLARDGLLPYRDYPYFHMPNLVWVYAALFQLTNQYLLMARLFSALCACGLLALVAFVTYRLAPAPSTRRVALACGAVALLMTNPLFTYTAGLAWNHDVAVLLASAGLVVCVYGLAARSHISLMLASGLLLGLATGTRLSFASEVAPLVAAIALVPGLESRRRMRLAGVFFGGIGLGLLPALALLIATPAQFVFGNLTYVELNTAYREQTGFELAMNFPTKIEYVARSVADQPGNLLLGVLFLLLVVPRLRWRPAAHSVTSLGVWLTTLAVPFALASALAPTPSFYQYFYSVVPLLVLAIVLALADSGWPVHRTGMSGGLIAVAVGLSTIYALPAYSRIATPASGWPAMSTHALAEDVGRAVKGGRVLTLAPLAVEGGGARTYPQLATGPFAWRVAGGVPTDRRKAFGVLAEDDLAVDLRADPPAGVLVGFEGDLEAPLIAYARGNNYRERQLPNGITLWVKP